MIDKIKHMVTSYHGICVYPHFLWYRFVLLTITLCSTFAHITFLGFIWKCHFSNKKQNNSTWPPCQSKCKPTSV